MKREAAFCMQRESHTQKKTSPEAGAPQGDEAKIALTMVRELSTPG